MESQRNEVNTEQTLDFLGQARVSFSGRWALQSRIKDVLGGAGMLSGAVEEDNRVPINPASLAGTYHKKEILWLTRSPKPLDLPPRAGGALSVGQA